MLYHLKLNFYCYINSYIVGNMNVKNLIGCQFSTISTYSDLL